MIVVAVMIVKKVASVGNKVADIRDLGRERVTKRELEATEIEDSDNAGCKACIHAGSRY